MIAVEVEIKNLGDVTTILNGGTPKTDIADFWDGDCLWITPADLGKLKGRYVADTPRKITLLGLSKSSAKLVAPNSVILSTRAPIGHLAINTVAMATNQGCRGIVPNKGLNPEYLYYFLWLNRELLDSLGTGATFRELSTKALASIQIPFPSLPEQERIVAKLDAAFAAIDKAKANVERNLHNAKELFQSKLNEVFSGKKEGWVEQSIQNLTTTLGDGLHGTPNYSSDGEYYFINGNNLTDGAIEIKENTKRVSTEEYLKHRKNLNDRTVLVSINGTLGNVALYSGEKVILGKSACYFNVKPDVNKFFIAHLMASNFFLEHAHKEATGATIKNVSLKTMRAFKVPVPPIGEQNRMVDLYDTIKIQSRQLQSHYTRKLTELETLKKSLLERAFRGEI